jgi:2-amino-4-hydroxy-6-hydroxymethyldihydropteridine diphosphokinase
MEKVILSLGSNKGDRLKYLRSAIDRIGDCIYKTPKISQIYESEPWGFNSTVWFLNIAMLLETDLSPIELLDELNIIEKELGRVRKSNASDYESRVIDIDIIFFGDRVLDEARLIIPHPFAHLRRFVLLPVLDISPHYIHPVLNKTIRELVESCPDKSELRLFCHEI